MNFLKYIVILSLIQFCNEKTSQKEVNKEKTEEKTLIVDNQTTEINRIYFIDIFNNINFLNPGINKFDLDEAYFQLIDGKYKISYLLKANEKIIVKANKYLKLNSGDKKRDLELKFPTEFFKNFDANNLKFWTSQLAKLDKLYLANPKKREFEFQKELEETNNFLSTYVTRNQLSNDFKILINRALKFRILNKELHLGNQSTKFPETYISDLFTKNASYFQNDDFLFLDTYRNSLLNHSNLLKSSNSIKQMVLGLKNNYSDQNYKWLLLSNILTEKSAYPNYKYTKSQIDSLELSFIENNKNIQLVEYFNNSIALEKTSFEKDEVVDILFNKKILTFVTNKFIYLDFWASWCGPCRAEMPYSKKLVEEYTKKGINFTFLSIDENPAAWAKASSHIGLINSYLIPNVSNSEIYKKLKISSIPRYVILNMNGEVINSDAPRPSDPKSKQLFDKLLQEK